MLLLGLRAEASPTLCQFLALFWVVFFLLALELLLQGLTSWRIKWGFYLCGQSGSVAEFLDKQHHSRGTRGEEEEEEGFVFHHLGASPTKKQSQTDFASNRALCWGQEGLGFGQNSPGCYGPGAHLGRLGII